MRTFWLYHADAVGVGVLFLGLAVIAWVLLDRSYARQAAARRAIDRALRERDIRNLGARYRALFNTLSRRPSPSWDETVTSALDLTTADPTVHMPRQAEQTFVLAPLADSYPLEPTLDTAASRAVR